MDIQKLISIYNDLVHSKKSSTNAVTQSEDFRNGLAAEMNKNYDESLKYYGICKINFPEDALIDLKLAASYEKQNNKEKYKSSAIDAIKNTLKANYDVETAFNVHPSLLLERHIMAEFIIQNKSEIEKRIEENLSTKKINQNKAFVFWDNPTTAPDIVKVALESQKKYIGQDFNLVILNKDNLTNYIEIPKNIKPMMVSNPTHFSDWLRTKLLIKFGGIWLDATCYVTQNLSDSLKETAKQECFFFTYKGSRVGSWFICANPNSYILNAIDIVMDLWWEKESFLTNYFMYHDIVEMLYWTDNKYKKYWDEMLKTHPNKALEMNKNLQKNFDLNLYNQISKNFFIHKLTYKVNPDCYNRNTFVNKISKDEKCLLLVLNQLKENLKNLKKIWTYKNNTYVFDLKSNDIEYAFDVYTKENLFYIDLVSRNVTARSKLKILNCQEKVNILKTQDVEEILSKIASINNQISEKLDTKFEYDMTFILTSFNRENIIKKALESLRNQNTKNIKYEVVIIDDCSTDNTGKFIKEYIEKHQLSNFTLVEKEYNSGNPSIPRNDGIFLAKGKYISFIDSDDYIDEDTAINAFLMAEKNESDIVFIRIGSSTGGRKCFGEKIFNFGNVDKADFQNHCLWSTPQIFHVFKKSFLIENRILFNPSYKKWEDLVFISKAMSKTKNYSILSDRIYYYLEDFQGDNLTFKDINIYEQCEILIDALNSYVIINDKNKYNAYMNRISDFIALKMKSKILNQSEKIFVLDLFKRNINLKLIDFSMIENLKIIKMIISNDFLSVINLEN